MQPGSRLLLVLSSARYRPPSSALTQQQQPQRQKSRRARAATKSAMLSCERRRGDGLALTLGELIRLICSQASRLIAPAELCVGRQMKSSAALVCAAFLLGATQPVHYTLIRFQCPELRPHCRLVGSSLSLSLSLPSLSPSRLL